MTLAALQQTEFLDCSSPAVAEFVRTHAPEGAGDSRRRAIQLYYAVRDGVLYEIYDAAFAREDMRASAVLARGCGLCIHKSIVYAATLRSIGVPARICFTDVRNHLCSAALRKFIGGDVFHYHALVSLRLDGRWIKATPVFNEKLCRLFGMAPLDFDGVSDSVHHPYDSTGARHMEILRDHGAFDDLPYETVLAGLREKHPNVFGGRSNRFVSGSLVADRLREQDPPASAC